MGQRNSWHPVTVSVLLWVELRRTRPEHFSSGLAPKATSVLYAFMSTRPPPNLILIASVRRLTA